MENDTDRDPRTVAGDDVGGKQLFWLPGLQELRAQRDMSMDALAKKSGLHLNTVSALENLSRGAYPRTAYKIARALEVDLSELRHGRGD